MRERLIVRAQSAVMTLQRPTPARNVSMSAVSIAGGREQLVLKMMGLEADVVLGDLTDPKKASENWGNLVWYSEGQVQQEHLQRVLDICMDTKSEAIEFVYSYYVGPNTEDVGDRRKSARPSGSSETYRLEPLSTGEAETKVNRETCSVIRMKVGLISFETDCRYCARESNFQNNLSPKCCTACSYSLISPFNRNYKFFTIFSLTYVHYFDIRNVPSLVRHFFKCFSSMVEPLPEQAQADREIEEIYRSLQVSYESMLYPLDAECTFSCLPVISSCPRRSVSNTESI